MSQYGRLVEGELQIIDEWSFKSFICKLPVSTTYRIASSVDIHIPAEILPIGFPEYMWKEVDAERKERIWQMYGDAVNPTSALFALQRRNPSYTQLKNMLSRVKYTETEGAMTEVHPSFTGISFDDITELVKVRFMYPARRQTIINKQTKQPEMQLIQGFAVVVIKPKSRLIESRTSDRRITHSIINKTVSILSSAVKLGEPKPLDMFSDEFVQNFLNWIDMVNSAGFELGPREDVATTILGGRPRVDLRKTERFKENIVKGHLRKSHVTSIIREGQRVNFRIYFREGRLSFTSLSSEEDVKFVLGGIEEISEGRSFAGPTKLADYFGWDNKESH